jgi:hypothetical protein
VLVLAVDELGPGLARVPGGSEAGTTHSQHNQQLCIFSSSTTCSSTTTELQDQYDP